MKLADVPTTNLKAVVNIVLVVFVVVAWAVACIFMGKKEPAGLDSTYVFLGALNGFTVGQYFVKRGTFKNSPPAAADIEDVQAGSTAAPGGENDPNPATAPATSRAGLASIAPARGAAPRDSESRFARDLGTSAPGAVRVGSDGLPEAGQVEDNPNDALVSGGML